MLRLGLLLVELGFFKSVEFLFFVRGHTKNACDRMFNLLKKRYHQSQIYSVESLSTLLNELDNVNYYHVTSEVFFDYNALLNHFYKSFPVGTVKRNHFFGFLKTTQQQCTLGNTIIETVMTLLLHLIIAL